MKIFVLLFKIIASVVFMKYIDEKINILNIKWIITIDASLKRELLRGIIK